MLPAVEVNVGVRIAEDRRPGKIIVDFEDETGRRRWKTFPKSKEGRRLAHIFAGELERKLSRGERLPDEHTTFGEIAEKWRIHCRATVTPQTAEGYETGLDRHLLPEFKDRPLARITRGVLKGYIERLLAAKELERGTVRVKVLGVAHNMFAWAMQPEQGYVGLNPASGLGLFKRKAERTIPRAMNKDQLGAFLGAARRVLNEDEYLHLLLSVRTGLRIGEAHGLQWADFLDEDKPRLSVERQALKSGGIGPPKSRKGYRQVDVSMDLRDELRAAWARRHEDRLKLGVPMSGWIVCPEFADPPTRNQAERARQRIARAMRRALTAAGLPHFRLHDLRHTFCTLLLAQGEPVQYVQQQAGHSSIAETVDTYGQGPIESPGAVDRMADRTKAVDGGNIAMFKSGANKGRDGY